MTEIDENYHLLVFVRAFWAGVELFDRGEFFAAHEAWEDHWRTSTDERERFFLQGLIQVAAAFHKLFEMGSVEAAQRLLARGLDKLERAHGLRALDELTTQGARFDLSSFRSALSDCRAVLASPAGFERSQVPRMRSALP